MPSQPAALASGGNFRNPIAFTVSPIEPTPIMPEPQASQDARPRYSADALRSFAQALFERAGARSDIAADVEGTLVAQGTSASPILFTSSRDTTGFSGGPSNAGRGDWNGIQFGAQSTGSVLDHVDIRFGSAGNPATIVTAGQLTITNSLSRTGKVVDLGGGPRNDKLQNAVAYYFHDYAGEGRVTKVVSAKFSDEMTDAVYRPIEGFTGKDVRAAEVKGVPFPTLLEPVDDLPPATMITSVQKLRGRLLVQGTSQDNGEIASVTVNGTRAKLVSSHAGVADWEVTLDAPRDGKLIAKATDQAGNVEKTGHELKPQFQVGSAP